MSWLKLRAKAASTPQKSPPIQQYDSYLIVPEMRKEALIRLFCFHCAGGNAANYSAKWSADLPKAIEYVGVQLPGRQTRMSESFITDMPELVKQIADSMTPLISKTNKPYAFLGHSLGSVIAYEVALELRRRELSLPQYLFFSGRGAPGTPDPCGKPSDIELPDAAFADVCIANFGPSDGLMDTRLRPHVVPALRADLKLYYNYKPSTEPPLPVPLAVWGASGDRLSQASMMETWRSMTSKAFNLEILDSDEHHFTGARKYKQSLSRFLTELVVGAMEDVWC